MPEKSVILAIDIGGTGLKASVVDTQGNMLADRVRVPTPHPCPPAVMVDALVTLVAPLKGYNRISIAFPGVVRDGHVRTAPNLDTEAWAGFDLPAALSRRLNGHPARMLNDADMQGLGVVEGQGLEFVMTLGTGAGTGLFRDGELMPHLELAHHPVHGGKTYDEYIGDAALKKVGRKRWNKRVRRVLDILETLLLPDRIFIGGGNARHLKGDLPKVVKIVANSAGIVGGAALWRGDERPKSNGVKTQGT